MMLFTTSEEFLKQFHLEQSQFTEVNFHTDGIGFSVQRAYPNGVFNRFQSAKNTQGADDSVALIHVSYDKNNASGLRVPVIIRISQESKYFMNRYVGLNPNNPLSPTKESWERSKKSFRPIELSCESWFNHQANLFESSGQQTSGIDLLEEIYRQHCNSAHYFKGMLVQQKFRIKELVGWLCTQLLIVVKFLLSHVFTREFIDGPDPWKKINGYEASDFHRKETGTLKLSGYQTSIPVVVLLCCIVLGMLALKHVYGFKPAFLHEISSNAFYTTVASILSLFFLDIVVPWSLFLVVNALIKVRLWAIYW